jgi:hypothetical protein
MKIGILGFITETSIDTMTFARRAESLGLDTFYLPKHPKFPWSANRPIRRAPTSLCGGARTLYRSFQWPGASGGRDYPWLISCPLRGIFVFNYVLGFAYASGAV